MNLSTQKEVSFKTADNRKISFGDWLNLPKNKLGNLKKNHLAKISNYSKEMQKKVHSIDAKISNFERLHESNKTSHINLSEVCEIIEDLPVLSKKIDNLSSKMKYLLDNKKLLPLLGRSNLVSSLYDTYDDMMESNLKIKGTRHFRAYTEYLGSGDVFEGFHERIKKITGNNKSDSNDGVKNAKNILNIQGDYDLKLLNKSYKTLALIHHPDKNNNSAESNNKFKEISTAYELLKATLQ